MVGLYTVSTAEIRESIFGSTAMLGIRLTLGAIFIAHGIPKFEASFAGFLEMKMFPVWLHYPVAAGEIIPGILLVAGVFSRMSGAIIAAIMLGIFITIDRFVALTGDKGMEYHLILFAAAILIMVMGPGRISVAHIVKRLPRWMH
ncbi:MAG: DoxX family protein [Nitrosopumilus sp. H8]|nr:MAG: DoxX family protein [Nitrosopumilus sp. H8]